MALEEVVNEQFLVRYRALLDAEDEAFDELEHASEDGDRRQFVVDLDAWRETLDRRLAFLERTGIAPASSPAVT
jgi:hypothetical protein